MMDTLSHSGDRRIDPDTFFILEHAVDSCLQRAETEVLYGDEQKGVKKSRSGIFSRIPVDAATEVIVAKYDPVAKERISEWAGKNLGVSIEGISGHVELRKELGLAKLFTTIYIHENGPIAELECRFSEEDTLSVESQECYDFAKKAGLGNAWVAAMYGHADNGLNQHSVVYFDVRMTHDLTAFIDSQPEQGSSTG